MIRVFQCVLILMLLGVRPATAYDAARFGELIRTEMQRWNVPGLAVGVVRADTVQYLGTAGVVSVDGGQPVDSRTVFALASTTKAMVASGILMLADEGRLTLDDRAIDHLPGLRFRPSWMDREITVRDLLAHRTGMPSTDIWRFFQDTPLEEQVLRLSELEPNKPFRGGFQYQNTMYELVGLIIERVAGQPWDTFLRERLWTPIGMLSTYSTRSQVPPDAVLVTPYYHDDGKWVPADWDRPAQDSNAAGSVLSTPADLVLWLQFLLRDGVTAHGERLLSEQAVAEMFSPQMLVDRAAFYPTAELTDPHWTTYGLGWFQQDFLGRKIDFHTGSLSGRIALIGLDRDRRLGMFVLGNRDHAELRHALLWEVMDDREGDDRPDWGQAVYDVYRQRAEKRDAEWREQVQRRRPGTQPSLEPAAYAGVYHSPVLGEVELIAADGGWTLRFGNRDMRASHWHFDTFLVEFPPWELRTFAQFTIGADGRIAEMNLFGETFRPTPPGG